MRNNAMVKAMVKAGLVSAERAEIVERIIREDERKKAAAKRKKAAAKRKAAMRRE